MKKDIHPEYKQVVFHDLSADYKFLTRYTGSTQTAQYQFGSANGLPSFYQTYRPDAVNKDLKWEIGQSLNVGLDFGFWNNRVNGSVNAYVRKSKDLIANSTVDPFTNFSNQIERNIGDMENRGIEFALNFSPIKNDNFEFSNRYIKSDRQNNYGMFNLLDFNDDFMFRRI